MRYLPNVSGIILFLRNAKDYTNLSYASFHIVPFCNYTLLPAKVKVEKHSWKPFCENLLSS
jgi:hypothetical protein